MTPNSKRRTLPTRYGQIVIGSGGSGKTTYCNGMQQYLRAIGRDCLVVNFDPANEIPSSATRLSASINADKHRSKVESDAKEMSNLPYDILLDVCEDVIHLSSVMEELNLGPNGGLLYCMEYIEKHMSEILELISTRLEEHEDRQRQGKSEISTTYLLFDFPGQVELFTHNTSVQRICQILTTEGSFRLAAVQLIDAHHCFEPSKFISAVLLSTTTMLRLELPTINVLSKVDLLGQYASAGNSMVYNLDFFTKATDLNKLIGYLEEGSLDTQAPESFCDGSSYYADDKDYRKAREQKQNSRFYRKYRKLHEQLCDVIDDFNLVSFLPLDIQSAESVGQIVAQVDKCNGYVFVQEFGAADRQNCLANLFQCAVQAQPEWEFERVANVHERYFAHDSHFQETITELAATQEKLESYINN